MTNVEIISKENVFLLSNESSTLLNLIVLIERLGWPFDGHFLSFFLIVNLDLDPVRRGINFTNNLLNDLFFDYFFFYEFCRLILVLFNLFLEIIFQILYFCVQDLCSFACFCRLWFTTRFWRLRLVVVLNIHCESEVTTHHRLRVHFQRPSSRYTNLSTDIKSEAVSTWIELLTTFVFWFEIRLEKLFLILLCDANTLIMYTAFHDHVVFFLS